MNELLSITFFIGLRKTTCSFKKLDLDIRIQKKNFQLALNCYKL